MNQINFDFVENSSIRKIIERDFNELQNLATEKTTKSVIIISGGILESLLIDALVFAQKLTFNAAVRETLENLLKKASEKPNPIVLEDVLSNSIRGYRNLVHPGKEIRGNIQFDSADAELAISAIKIISRDIKKWYERERFLRKLEESILQADDNEKTFLKLFTLPTPTQPDQPEHPWLEFEEYSSIIPLIRRGILQVEELEKNDREKYDLFSDAIPFVEALLKQTIERTSIVIDLSNVAASLVSGSGASNNMVRR